MRTGTVYFFLLLLAQLSAPLAVSADEFVDTDADGLSDEAEVQVYGTLPDNPDTDGDTFPDGEEVQNGYSPRHGEAKKLTAVDSDIDGLKDDLEIKLGTKLFEPDTDGDGASDGKEAREGYSPFVGGGSRAVERRAEVDLSTQRLHYFMNNVRLGTVAVSTGLRRTPTPTGQFAIGRKLPVHRYTGADYDFPGTKWNLEFKRGYYLHGAYWHNQFGKRPMSHGCVNIAYKDAQKIFAFLQPGDQVKIYGTTPTGAVRVAAKP